MSTVNLIILHLIIFTKIYHIVKLSQAISFG